MEHTPLWKADSYSDNQISNVCESRGLLQSVQELTSDLNLKEVNLGLFILAQVTYDFLDVAVSHGLYIPVFLLQYFGRFFINYVYSTSHHL
jgi:hypothetical protein